MILILVALAIMVAWGVGDYFLSRLSKSYNPYVVNFWFGVFQVFMYSLVYFLFFYPAFVPIDYLWLLPVMAIISVVAFISFLKGFEVGKASLITPISSAYGVLTMILSMVFLGERLSQTQFFGIIISTVGLLFTSINISELKNMRLKSEVQGLKFAILSFICWGVNFTLFGIIVKASDWLTPFFLYTPIIAVLGWLAMKANVKRKEKTSLPMRAMISVLLIVFLGQAAFMLYSYSLGNFPSALLAPIGAAYPGITILMAHFLLKEKMALIQYAGCALILVGLVVAAV